MQQKEIITKVDEQAIEKQKAVMVSPLFYCWFF
jgi:hypothetical protein